MTFTETPTTPDGAQWAFTWDAMGVEAVIDLGVASSGFYLAYDATAYGMEGYVEYIGAPEYRITKTDDYTGVITLVTYNMYGEEQTMDIAYEHYGTSCHFVCEPIMLDAYAGILPEPVEIISNGIAQ